MILIIDSVEKENIRIDSFLKDNSTLSRNYISSLIENGFLKVNGKEVVKPSYKTKLKDVIEWTEKEPEILDVLPEDIKLNIIYEDEDILIINKERGMVVHPSNGHLSGTLVNAIMYHCKDNLSSINGVIRPGIVHRIDKETSGVLCICKNDFAHRNIAEQFKNHTNVRKYKGIVKGVIKEDEGVIDKPIGRDKKNRLRMAVVGEFENGKNAKTFYKVLERFDNYTYVEWTLVTGRTHQIRVHMKDKGYPLLGDVLYGNVDKRFSDLNGQVLNAYYLEIDSPSSGKRLTFAVDNPIYFENILEKLRNGKK